MRSKDQPQRIMPASWLEPIELGSYFDDPTQPLEIDLGCGKGRFLLGIARKNPQTNFLGIDRMLGRIRKTGNKIRRKKLHNIRLLRMEGSYALKYLIPKSSVTTYYYFFPDPWPKKKHHQNRLLKEETLHSIQRTLKPGGVLQIATDHRGYFDEMHALLSENPAFQATQVFFPSEGERTDFELIFRKARAIHRCAFKLIGAQPFS